MAVQFRGNRGPPRTAARSGQECGEMPGRRATRAAAQEVPSPHQDTGVRREWWKDLLLPRAPARTQDVLADTSLVERLACSILGRQAKQHCNLSSGGRSVKRPGAAAHLSTAVDGIPPLLYSLFQPAITPCSLPLVWLQKRPLSGCTVANFARCFHKRGYAKDASTFLHHRVIINKDPCRSRLQSVPLHHF